MSKTPRSPAQWLSNDAVSSHHYYRALSESAIAINCVLRHASLFLYRTPQTPLRVLCIIAYDTLYGLRKSDRLSSDKVRLLSAILDFAACVNAALDHKSFNSRIYQATRAQIDHAGAGALVDDFVRRLQMLECRGHRFSQDSGGFEHARRYRESVVRLNMGLLAAIVFDLQSMHEGIQRTYDTNIDSLFRVVMLCQIIDDVIDYRKDTAGGLLSFLTSSELPVSLAQTSVAAQSYAQHDTRPHAEGCRPFRYAIKCVSLIAQIAIRYACWKHLSPATSNRLTIRRTQT